MEIYSHFIEGEERKLRRSRKSLFIPLSIIPVAVQRLSGLFQPRPTWGFRTFYKFIKNCKTNFLSEKQMKKVLAITGIRSEYDILFPVLNKLRQNNSFELKVVVSGAHLSDWHGYTIETIQKDGFVIADRVDSLLMTDRVTQRPKGTGILIQALAQTVERENPDFLLVVGDREESLATAIVGNYMNVLVAHLGGGDTVYGNADDPVRFAVSKLAHIHFAFAKPYAENLIRSGEEEFRVFCVGDPGLDNINNIRSVNFDTINDYLKWNIEPQKFIVLLNHPLSSEVSVAGHQMRTLLEICKSFCSHRNLKTVGIYPNTDPGSSDILKAIHELKDNNEICFFKTLPRDIFVNIFRQSLALIGNSSMGILEAPFYELPVINVGNRQKGRLNAGNVEFVDLNPAEITKSLEKACFDVDYRRSIKQAKLFYGDGQTADKIVNVLCGIDPQQNAWHVKRRMC